MYGFAVVDRHADVVPLILIRVNATIGFERDQVAGLTRFQKGAVDIGTMGHGIGLSEAL